jgi:NAD(P)-dependent dehydrogenase (short-subunit alcohol dehydrogenase family)
MSRVFITGSSDGLGQLAGRLLVQSGHQVVLHGRNEKRASHAISAVPGAEAVVTGDLSSVKETVKLAEQVNQLGVFDAVIHNAGVGYRESVRVETVDKNSQLFAVNSLAPYILTCLITRPKRLVYISSALHRSGDPSLKDLNWVERRWNGFNAYADSKLHDVILAFAVARKWPAVFSNALEPGWVATKMGGPAAPDDLEQGPQTQVWLASSKEPEALTTGKYFFHKQLQTCHPASGDPDTQERFLSACAQISGIPFPATQAS